MKVRALRGVCIAPGRNLAPGEIAELSDPQFAAWLVHILAAEIVADVPAEPEPAAEPEPETQPAKKRGK